MKLTSYQNGSFTLYGPSNMSGVKFYPCAISKSHRGGRDVWVVHMFHEVVTNMTDDKYILNTFDTEDAAIAAVEFLLA